MPESAPLRGFVTAEPDARLISYVGRVRSLLAAGMPREERLQGVMDEVQQLARSGAGVGERCRCISPGEPYGRNLVYRDPDFGFVLISMVWPHGSEAPAHDHGTWCCVAVLEGRVKISEFVRAEQEASAVRLLRTYTASAGETCIIHPPRLDVHRVWNPFDEPALTLHTYGREIRTCNVYDALGRAREHCEMGYANL